MYDNKGFLSEDEKDELNDLFGCEVTKKKLLSYWDKFKIRAEGQRKEAEKKGYVPGKPKKEGGIFVARELELVQKVQSLDNEELKYRKFYERKIRLILQEYKNNEGRGWKNIYRVPISYCTSQLEKIKIS